LNIEKPVGTVVYGQLGAANPNDPDRLEPKRIQGVEKCTPWGTKIDPGYKNSTHLPPVESVQIPDLDFSRRDMRAAE
jgi:hypothetical protein